MSVKDKYHGADQIHTTNGAGMDISHVGHTLTLQFVPLVAILISIIFFMFLRLIKTWCLFIALLLIIKVS